MSRSLPSQRALPALLLVVLGLAVVGWSGFAVYDDFRPDYRLTAGPTEAPSDATVRAYGDLSPDARAAFDRARDGGLTVHEEPAWDDDFRHGSSYVRYDGTVYEVLKTCDCVRGLSLLVAVPGALLGLSLTAVGGLSYRRGRTRLPLSILVGVGAGWLAWLVGPVTGTRVFGTSGAPLAVGAFLLAGAVTWVVLRGRDVA